MNLPTVSFATTELNIIKHQQITPKMGKIYMVVSGVVAQTIEVEDGAKTHIKRLLGAGDIFPLYIPGKNFDESVSQYRTTVTGKVLEFSEDELVTILTTSEEMRQLYLEYLGNILRSTEHRYVNQLSLSAPKRIIHLLMQLAENKQFSKDFDGQKEIKCGLTQNDYSSLVGCSRQTFTHIINKLCELELLSFNRNRILIYDLNPLSEYLESLS